MICAVDMICDHGNDITHVIFCPYISAHDLHMYVTVNFAVGIYFHLNTWVMTSSILDLNDHMQNSIFFTVVLRQTLIEFNWWCLQIFTLQTISWNYSACKVCTMPSSHVYNSSRDLPRLVHCAKRSNISIKTVK